MFQESPKNIFVIMVFVTMILFSTFFEQCSHAVEYDLRTLPKIMTHPIVAIVVTLLRPLRFRRSDITTTSLPP